MDFREKFETRFYGLSPQTWAFLALYLGLVVYHISFVQAPGGPGLATESVETVDAGAGFRLIDLAVLPPDGMRAIAGLRGPDGSGHLWLLDWAQAKNLVTKGRALPSLKLAETPAKNMAKRASYNAPADIVEYVTSHDDGGLARWVWEVGRPSRSRALPRDYLFTTRGGQDVTVAEAERAVSEQIPSPSEVRITRELIVESKGLIITRPRNYGISGGARDDDFYAFDRSSGRARGFQDTSKIFKIFTPPRFDGAFYTDGSPSFLSAYSCDENDCWDLWPRISTDGAEINALDYLPDLGMLALCVSKGQSHSLMIFENPSLEEESSSEHATYLGSIDLSSSCSFLSLIDSRTVVLRQANEWSAISFSPSRGGLIH